MQKTKFIITPSRRELLAETEYEDKDYLRYYKLYGVDGGDDLPELVDFFV